jgi:hypothetical protein
MLKRVWTAPQTIGPALKAVRLATVAALPACTAAGTGVGHTLTADAVGVLSVDSTAVVLNDRVLVKDQIAADDNGIYLCTTAGTAGVAFVLTRATDFDAASAGEVAKGEGALVSAGATLIGTSWILTTSGAITVDTTSLTFAQGGGDDDVVTSDPVNTKDAAAIGIMVTATEVNAPLVGYIEVQHANAEPNEIAAGTASFRAYGGIVLAGTPVTDGQLDVSGTTTFDIELIDFPFGWLRFKWVGDTGSGAVELSVMVKRRAR